jgi:uncharacterized protein YaiL (DUF2058 family)
MEKITQTSKQLQSSAPIRVTQQLGRYQAFEQLLHISQVNPKKQNKAEQLVWQDWCQGRKATIKQTGTLPCSELAHTMLPRSF